MNYLENFTQEILMRRSLQRNEFLFKELKERMNFVRRQRVCDCGHSAGAASAKRGKLPDPVAGRRRPAGGLPRHAAGRRLRSGPTMDPGAGTVRHVDLLGCALLHGVDSSFGRHSARQVGGFAPPPTTPTTLTTPAPRRLGHLYLTNFLYFLRIFRVFSNPGEVAQCWRPEAFTSIVSFP